MPNSHPEFSRSPMIRRIEGDQRNSVLKRIGGIAAAIAAAAIAVVAVGPEVMEFFAKKGMSAGSGEVPIPYAPGDLDYLDQLHNEEHGFPFSPGSPDGCVLLSVDEQLESPLCCPHVSSDPATCPPLDGEFLPGRIEMPEQEIPKPTPPPPHEMPTPKRIPSTPIDLFEDLGVKLPG